MPEGYKFKLTANGKLVPKEPRGNKGYRRYTKNYGSQDSLYERKSTGENSQNEYQE
jgi:hypothetical protein